MLDAEAGRILSKLDGKLDDVLDRVGKTQTEVKILNQRTDRIEKTVDRMEKVVIVGNGQPSVLSTQARHGEQLEAHRAQISNLFRKADDQKDLCGKKHRSRTPTPQRAVSIPPRWRRPRVVISGSAIVVLIPVITWAVWRLSGGEGQPPPLPSAPTAQQSAK